MYNFAIIGCGRISIRHAENIKRVGNLVAVCDVVQEKAIDLATAFNATPYYNIDDLLMNEKEVDVVSICTPNGLHTLHSIKAMESGKNVLCEKPLSISSSTAHEMIEAERRTGKRLFVVKSTRYVSVLKDLKKYITDGQLGSIYSFHLSCIWNRPAAYYTDWRGTKDLDGGTLFTQFSHYIDAMLWLFGDVEAANGFSTNAAHQNSIEFEDTGAASLKMKSGAVGSIHWSVNSFNKNHEIALTVVAENATIRIGGEYLNQVEYLNSKTKLLFSNTGNSANDYNFYKGSMSNHGEVYDHLIHVLQHEDDHSFTGANDGLKTVEAIEKIYSAIFKEK